VYAFAAILVSYLLATFMGSRRYRIEASRRSPSRAVGLWTVLTLLSLFPLALIDERSLRIGWIVRATLLVLSIVPFCAALGYLTPLVIDAYAGGSARRASRAYAANVIGCILGPLCAGWILLPTLGERGASAALALVLLAIGAWAAARAAHDRGALTRFSICAAIAAAVALGTRTYAETVNGGVVMHDETATVVASGSGMAKELTVNGIGMTGLTTITKVMAHLPMAQLDRPPRAVLDICFGMGTTFRSLAAWDVDVTAVDLVPSVPAEFGYFHADADAVRRRPHTRIVVDDGRRFLDRTRAQYDVVTIDPPPPLPAAGSSLLYSREMYEAARHRLVPGGILHQWSPVMERSVVSSITQALAGEFRYLRVFVSIDGWGYHFLASDAPIPRLSARDLTQRLSEAARRDLVEWKPDQSPESLFALLLSREVDPATLVRPELRLGPVTDDHPTNEYFLVRTLRRLGSRPVQ